jgi:periplasmic protein TonB
LSFYGVISIQFRWPQNVASQAVAPPANGSEVAKISGSPTVVSSATGREADRSVPGTSVSSVSPAITKKVSTPAPDPPAARVSQPNSSKPATPTTTSSPKSHLEKLMTAKPIAPSPVKPAAPSEVLPPSFELPGKSDSGGQLSMVSPKSPAPAPPAAATTRVSGNFEEAQLITRSAPVFPMVAKQAGVSGSVQLQFTITTEGKVRDVSVIKGNPMLSRAAIDAVQTWRYHPARLGGIPIEAQSTTIINFKSN